MDRPYTPPPVPPNRGRGGSAKEAQDRRARQHPERYGRPAGAPGTSASTSAPAGPAFTNKEGQVSYTPPNFQSTAQRDPQLDAMYQRYGQQDQAYQGQINSLAAGNDRDAINAMQRQRDMLSGMQSEGAENSARRGLGPNTGAAQQTQNDLQQRGLQSMSGLNAGLASDARRQQLAALSGQTGVLGQQTGAAQASSAAMLGQQQQGLDQWRTQQQANLGAAQLAAMQNQNLWQNQMGLFQAMTPFYQGYPGMSSMSGYTGYGNQGSVLGSRMG